MKKFVFAFAVIVLVGSAFASAQKSDIVKAPGSVTFKVEDVKVARKILPVTNGFELGRKLAGGPYLDCSFKNKSLVDGGENRDTTSANTIRADKHDETKVVVSGGKRSAGDIITGNVRDKEGPMMVVNVIERDAEERIVAHCISDMEGTFELKLVNPDHCLEISYVGYRTVRTPITGTHFEITMSERDDLPKVEIMSEKVSNSNPGSGKYIIFAPDLRVMQFLDSRQSVPRSSAP